MKKQGYIILTLKFQKQGRRWLAHCDELGTATFGRSLPEADNRIKDAVLLHLNTLEEVGESRRFFKENGIKIYPARPKEDITICLPIDKEVFVEPHIQAVPELSAV